MNLYDQCLLHVVNHQEQLDTSVLPRIIREDINDITTLLNDLGRWKAKIVEKEEVQSEVDLWQYIEQCLILYYEHSLIDFTCDELEYWEEIQVNVIKNDKKMQDIDMELENLETIIQKDKANISPHLSHIFEQITLNDYSKLIYH